MFILIAVTASSPGEVKRWATVRRIAAHLHTYAAWLTPPSSATLIDQNIGCFPKSTEP